MKLTVLFLTAGFLNVCAKGVSQHVTFSGDSVSLESVFISVRKQTGFLFLYTEPMLRSARPVTISANNLSLKEFLDEIFKSQPLKYDIKGQSIFIREKASIPSFERSGNDEFLLPSPVRGRVLDEDGQPLAGASVLVKGSKNSTSTGTDGVFSLSVNLGDVLLISFVGYQSAEYKITSAIVRSSDRQSNNIADIIIKLKRLDYSLDTASITIINTGYQRLKANEITGSIVQIDNELYNRKVSGNVLDRIYEVTSGLLYSNSNNNRSDDRPPLLIRGISTIRSNYNPLIVVDNFPYEGNLDNLNPNDVESITVLKDASAASIWGTRAGNGVIVVTTKKGKFNQAPKVQLNTNFTIGEKPALFYIPIMSSSDAVDFEIARFKRGNYNVYDDFLPSINFFTLPLPLAAEVLLKARRQGVADPVNDPQVKAALDMYRSHDVRSDIEKYLLQKSVRQQYALNVSGGSNLYNYYGSIGYDRSEPNQVNNSNDRISLRLSNSWKPLTNLELSAEINYTQTKSESSSVNYSQLLPLGSSPPISPYTVLADGNGIAQAIPYQYRLPYVDSASYPALLDWHYRPIEEINNSKSRNKLYDTRVNAEMRYRVFKGFTAAVYYQFQKSLSNSMTTMYENSFYVRDQINKFMYKTTSGEIKYPYPKGDFLTMSNSELNYWSLRGQINYDYKSSRHSFSAIAGSEIRESLLENSSKQIIGFNPNLSTAPIVDIITAFPARPSGSPTPIGGSETSIRGNLNRNGSYFGNFGYIYDDKYLISASARVDQSNFFGVKSNLRFVPLWSAGLGWVISNTKFYSVKSISYLKLRLTYGYNGNANNTVTTYPTIRYSSPSFIVPTGAVYANIVSPSNPQLRWERVKIINLGIEFASNNNTISGIVDFYKKRGIDLIGPIEVDPTTGLNRFTGNTSSIKGNGIDLRLNFKIIDRKLKWSNSIIASYNTDKVTSYYNTSTLTASSLLDGGGVVVGRPLFQLSSYHWAGLDPTNGSPRIYLGDTITSYVKYNLGKPEDMLFHGSKMPRYFGSMLNSLSMGDFSISFNITYRFNYYFRRSTVNYTNLYNGWSTHKDYALRWQTRGDEINTNVPSMPLGADGRDDVYKSTSVLVERGDHIRLQDSRISYNLRRSKLRKMPFENIQLYLYANNIGILWRANDKGIDPDAYSFGSIPLPRTYAAGFNVIF